MSIESYEASLKSHYANVLRKTRGRKVAVVNMPAPFWEAIMTLRPIVVQERKERHPRTLEGIKAAVCQHLGISREDFESERRARPIIHARHLYFWFGRKYTPASYPIIGRHCGNRDHTTVLHGVRKVEGRMADYAADIENIEEMLK